MRVIDADRLQKQFNEKSTNPYYRVNMHNIKSIISNAPTVEAIPKADYENRLKADMAAILDKIRAEILDTLYVDSLIFGELIDFKNGKISADDVIEEFNRVTRLEVLKIIDKYKAESEG